MKRRIKLSESQLHRIIKESVKRAINEISLDTIDSAGDAACEKYDKLGQQYGEADPRTKHALDQCYKFKDYYKDEYDSSNLAKRARMKDNQQRRLNGTRRYINGKGWRNDM